jgi:hypothetical protein
MEMVNGGKKGVNYPQFLAFYVLKMSLNDKRQRRTLAQPQLNDGAD